MVFASGHLLDLVFAWTLPVAATALLTLWVVESYMPRSKDRPQSEAAATTPQESAHSFWTFSSARGVATIVETILEWIDVLTVTTVLGPAAGGVYGAVNRCVRVGTMVEHTGRIVTGPSISAALATQNVDRARQIFLATPRVLTAISWPPHPAGVLREGLRRGGWHPVGYLSRSDALNERWRCAVYSADER